MDGVALLEFVSGLLIFLGFTWLVGSLCSRSCLGAGDSQAALGSASAMRHGEPLAAILCIGAAIMSVYAAAASMSGLPLVSAHQAFWVTLTQTAVGRNCLSGLACMVLIIPCTLGAPRRWSDVALGILLAGFAWCSAMTSHAAEQGLLSIAFAMQWLHLVLAPLWLGIVVMGAWIIVPRYRDAGQCHREERDSYLERLSASATVALGGILVSGLYTAYLRIGTWDNASGNPYATVLLVKGAIVFLALAIGAYNRFIGFPAIVSTGKVPPLVLLLLRIESFLLAGVLFAAVSLGSLPPPSSL